jgi:hypothetical protein
VKFYGRNIPSRIERDEGSMKSVIKLSLAVILFVTWTMLGQAQRVEPSKTAVQNSQPASAADESDTMQDLARMRLILNQMRTNLAFVGNTTTPLAHQFQLDIDMWQALIDQMERREQERSPTNDQK